MIYTSALVNVKDARRHSIVLACRHSELAWQSVHEVNIKEQEKFALAWLLVNVKIADGIVHHGVSADGMVNMERIPVDPINTPFLITLFECDRHWPTLL